MINSDTNKMKYNKKEQHNTAEGQEKIGKLFPKKK